MIGWLVAVVVDIHLGHGMLYLPVFIGVPAILLLVAAVACWLPASPNESIHRGDRRLTFCTLIWVSGL